LINKQNTDTFFSVADKVGTFLFANFIWVALSMTIIGIPFATAGLFAVMMQYVRGLQPEAFRHFGGAIRNYWRKIVPITLLDVFVGGLLFINYNIFQVMAMDNVMAILSGTMTVCITLVLVMVNIYVWSCLPILNISTRNLIKLSLILGLTYPFTSIGIVLLTLVPLVLSLFLPIAFYLFVSISAAAYIGARSVWYVLNKHFPDDELADLLYT
jgi:uncharacterized membrane protein YesL